MARKGRGDRGLFEKVKGSEQWWIRYTGPDRERHAEFGGTKTEARAKLARRQTEIADGTWQKPHGHGAHAPARARERLNADPLTLGEFANTWLEERKPWLTPRTVYDYRMMLARMLLSHPLARKSIAEVDDGDIARLIKELCERPARDGAPLAARSVNMLIARLRTIFATAGARGLIAADPMRRIKNLREAKPEVDPFDQDEALRLIDAAQEWERAFLSVLLLGGLRPNEALALTWNEIDFAHSLIRVRHNLVPRHGLGLPKTSGSERDVEMIAIVRRELAEQRAQSQLRGELVFPSQTGTLLNLDNFRSRNWPRLWRRAKVRPRALYQCRHTFARLLLEQGDHPQHVAAMLGHTSVRMVFHVYGRWLRRPESPALAKLDAALSVKAGHHSGHHSTLRSGEIK